MAALALDCLMPPSAARAQGGVACVSSAETRELYVANKLVQPYVVMREAARGAEAEPIGIQLCRNSGTLVYDVTLLDRTGRVIHRLVGATNGAAAEAPPPSGLGSLGAPGLKPGARPE